MPSQPELTFGVEIELVVELRLPSGYWVPPGDFMSFERKAVDEIACHRVSQRLENAGLAVEPAGHSASTGADGYLQWSVKPDISIEPIQISHSPYQRTGIELISPKLAYNTNSLQQIEKALAAARNAGKLYTSHSCALHVHLGQADGRPFPLKLAKSFLGVVVAHEKLVESMLDPDVVSDFNRFSYFCEPVSANSIFSDLTPIERVALINLEAKTYEQLVGLVNPPEPDAGDESRYYSASRRLRAWNVTGLGRDTSWRGQTTKPTIEARRHPASLDANEIWRWVGFLVRLVIWCQKAPAGKVDALVERAEEEGYGLKEFLCDLEADRETVRYWCTKTFSTDDDQPGDSLVSDLLAFLA
ncbi:MAG: hypothetical protein MMC23_003812 [Stictis urceolatum]|nr:hypothetical protein [Stictis urceolata]